jgi:ubiquinone/menaquinone biosynthesis C-methylase UbiE
MDTDALGKSIIGRLFMRIIAAIMESRIRYKFFGPQKILEGAKIKEGMKVLEIGCGTGFFTIIASKMVRKTGKLISIDMSSLSVEMVNKKVEKAGLQNVMIVKGNALDTKLEENSLDEVFIFGVLPAPMLPMDQLISEMKRIIKPGGIMAVWPPTWVHQQILKNGKFKYIDKKNNVYTYEKI